MLHFNTCYGEMSLEELIQQIEELYNDEKYEEAIELANEVSK